MFPISQETNLVTAQKTDQIMLNITYNEKKLLICVCVCVYVCMGVYARARLFVCVFLAAIAHQGTQDEYLKGQSLDVVL
jgi:hypothetical protein